MIKRVIKKSGWKKKEEGLESSLKIYKAVLEFQTLHENKKGQTEECQSV